MPVSSRSLKFYLSKLMKDSYKEAIIKKLKVLCSFDVGIDSDPIDAYRLRGRIETKIEMIEEVNNIMMRAVSTFYHIREYAKELYELKSLCKEQLSSSISMINALVAQGNLSGVYTPEPDDTIGTKSQIVKETAKEQGLSIIDIPLSDDPLNPKLFSDMSKGEPDGEHQ
jgi:hypothetical protein